MADPVWRVVLVSIIITVQLVAGFILAPRFSRRPFISAFATRLKAALALKLDRPERGEGSLKVRGTIAVIFFLVVGWSVATLLDAAVNAMPYGWVLQALIVMEAIGAAHILRFQRVGVRAKSVSEFSKGLDRFAAASGFDLAKKDHHSNARLVVMYQLYAFSIFFNLIFFLFEILLASFNLMPIISQDKSKIN